MNTTPRQEAKCRQNHPLLLGLAKLTLGALASLAPAAVRPGELLPLAEKTGWVVARIGC